MHVCYLFHREFPQNYSTRVNEYPRVLTDFGIDVTVIAATTTDDRPRHETLNGVNVYRIPTTGLSKTSLAPTRFAYRGMQILDRLCQREPIDVLHMSAFPGLGLLLRPVPWFNTPSAVVVDVPGMATSTRAATWVSKAALKTQTALVETVITLDPLMAEHIFGDRTAAEIVPLGADFEHFHPGNESDMRQSLGFSSSDVVFGYVGNLNEVRNLDRAIDAFARIHETHPEAKLVLIGDGDDRSHLERYAVQTDCADAVTFTGEIPFADVPRYVRAFDVGFAHIPDRQPFRIQPPLKTVEFLASGLPVLATDTPGNRRFVEDDENGILCPDSPAAYANAIQELTDSPMKRDRLSANARSSVREYDYTYIIENSLLPLYKRIADAETTSGSLSTQSRGQG